MRPHHNLIARLCKRLEVDPTIQYKIHVWASRAWVVNMACAILVFFLLPSIWASASILYLVLVSLYANWATDFDGISSSLAAIHAMRASKSLRSDFDRTTPYISGPDSGHVNQGA